MKSTSRVTALLALAAVFVMLAAAPPATTEDIFKAAGQIAISLPTPSTDGQVSLEKAISQRRSVQAYANDPLSLQQVSQILWAAQGVTESSKGERTYPSALATYPLDVYVVAKSVKAVQSRVYKYDPKAHKLILEPKDDSIDAFYDAAGQEAAKQAPACLVITINPSRTAEKLGDNAGKCAYMEAGHAAQNVCLEATAMGLSTSTIGDFNAGKVRKALAIPKDEHPVYVMPLGKGKQ